MDVAQENPAQQVGVNYQQYRQLMIDAKASVNEAERTIPRHTMLTALSEAMRAYKDAAGVWDFQIRCEHLLGLKREYGHGDIIDRYNLPALGLRKRSVLSWQCKPSGKWPERNSPRPEN
jgi:hypothetical protein